jgi:arginase
VEGSLTAPLALVAMLCRTSDRTPDGARGAEALARELGERRGLEPRMVGTPGEARAGDWQDDLRDSRGCLLEAGGQVDDALAAGAYPVLLASDCSICMTTLPAVLRHHPEATVLWLDAHGDFNSPETTPSGFLGGMCLAAACGVWDAGLGDDLPTLDAARVVMCGVRDLDGGERVLLETNGVVRITRPSALADALRDREVYVHLDMDVLDPSILPATFPAPGGLSDGGLRTLLDEVAGACTLIGCEITAFGAPELAELIATVVEPLVPETDADPTFDPDLDPGSPA